MKKKILSLLALSTLMLAACGGGNNPEPTPDPSYDPDPVNPNPDPDPDPSGDDKAEWSDAIKQLLKDHAYNYALPCFEDDATGTLVGEWDEEGEFITLSGATVNDMAAFVGVETVLLEDGFINVTETDEEDNSVYYSYEKEIQVPELGTRTVMIDICAYNENAGEEDNPYALPGTFTCFIYDSYIYSWADLDLNAVIAELAELESVNIPELVATKYMIPDELTALMYWYFLGMYPVYCYGVTEENFQAFVTALGTAGWVASDDEEIAYLSSDGKLGLSPVYANGLAAIVVMDPNASSGGGGGEGGDTESDTFPSEAVVEFLDKYDLSVEVPAAVSQNTWKYYFDEDNEVGEYMGIYTEDLGTPGVDSIEDTYLATLREANWIIDDTYYDEYGYYAGKDGVVLQFFTYEEEFDLYIYLGELEQGGGSVEVPDEYEGVVLTLADESCLVTKDENESVWVSGEYTMTVKKGSSNQKVGNPGGGKEFYANPLRTYKGQIIEFTWPGDAPSMIIIEMDISDSRSVPENLTSDAVVEGAEWGFTTAGIVAFQVNEGATKVSIEVGGQARFNKVVFVA